MARVDEGGSSGATGPRRGVIREILPRALYRVTLEDGHEVIAHAAAGPRKNFVRLVVGDRVTVELATKDVKRGRIVRRINGAMRQ